MSKRIISMILALILLFSSIPVQAYATTTDTLTEALSAAVSEAVSAEINDESSVILEDVTLSLGEISQTPADETEAAQTTEVTEVTEATEATVATETTETTEATVATETTEATEATETTEVTEATEATEPTEEDDPEFMPSNVVPEGYEPRSYQAEEELDMETEAVKFPNRRVLLIEDNLPWDSDANHRILKPLAEYDTVKPSDVGRVDVSKYAVIILANDQATSSYTAYARFADKIEEFAERGGVIVFGACDAGWSNGYMSDIIPGGVKKANRYTYYNTIVDATHPIVIGQLTDNKTLTDNHLYHNYCSHTYFLESSFPEGTRVILKEKNGYPTLIEYPLGNGRVIASGLTWEHNLVHRQNFAPVAMDDLYNYALYVSGIGNQDLEHLMHNKLKDNEHMIIVVESKTKDPISGAEVNFNGKKYTSDENGQIRISGVNPGKVTVSIKKDGYRTRTFRHKVLGGDMQYIFLDPYKDGGAYITGAEAKVVTTKKDGSKQTEYYDLFLETVNIQKDAEYTITLNGEWGNKKAGKYMLYLGSQCAYSTNGVFTIKNGKCSNSAGAEIDFGAGKLHARMVSSDGKQSEAAELNLYSPKESEGSLWEESETLFSVGGKDGIKIQIPKEMPVVGGAEFQVKLDEIPVCVELKEDSIQIAIGVNKLNKEEDPAKAMADWKKKWEAVDRTSNLKEVMKAYGAKSGAFTLKKGWDTPDLDIIGYAEGKWNKDTNQITEISGGFIVSVDFMYRYNQQFVVGPVPLYFEIGGGVELKDQGKVQGILVDAKQLILDNELTVTPKFSIGGGVGINGALSVGAEGTAKLPILLCGSKWNVTDKTYDTYTNVSLSGEMDLRASLLFVFNAKHSIAKGEWQILRYYWDTGAYEWFEAEDLQAQSVTDFSDTNSFSLMSRSYLNKTSDWYTEGVSTAAFQDGMTVLQSGVMPTSDPQIVYCDDGTAVMVFQADNADRSSLNRSCLMYSVHSNGFWSTPQPVWDNGCADMAASLATGAAGTYVVWQKLDQVLSDDASVDQVASYVEIASAVFDPATGTFVDAEYLTDDNVLQMMPTAAVGDTEATALYVTNTSSQLLGGGTNKIIRTSLTGSGTSEIYSGDAYVTALTASVVSGKVNTAYILDTDASLETVTDTQLYVNGAKIHETDGAQLNAQYYGGTLYWYDEAEQTICAYSGGKVSQLIDPDASVGNNFQIMRSSNGKFAITWLGVTPEGKECIYAKIRSGNSWSSAVELVTSDSSLMQMAGYLDDQGKWELVALSREGENSANLLYSGVTPYLTTTAQSITYIARNREDLYPQILADFTNGSENTLDHLTVDIHDQSGNLVHSQVVECQILGGENQQLVLDVDLPVQTEVKEYIVTIYPEGEEYLSDNQGTITVGYSDLILLMDKQEMDDNTMINIRIYNDSDLASEATLTVREGDPVNGIVMDMRSLGELNPGETYNINYSYDLSKMDFRGEEAKVYYYQVSSSAAESLLNNNEASVTFHNPEFAVLEPPVSVFTNAPDPVELNLDSRQSYQIAAKAEPEASEGWVLLYSSSDPSVATVDENGMLQAVREGEAVISIQAENTDVVRYVTVLVNPPAAKKLTLKLKEISEPTTDYQVNDQYSFQVFGAGDVPMGAHLFQVTSSDPEVIRVDENTGVLHLQKPGNATIKVTYKGSSKLKVSQKIAVIAERPARMELEYTLNNRVNQQAILEMKTQDLKAAALQLTPRTINERGAVMDNVSFTFKSNNTAVAKVNKDGMITGTGKEGIAVISAVAKGSSLATELTLYVYDTGAPLLAADSKIALNSRMTTNHPDAPVVQLQSILSNYISTIDSRLYQLAGKDNYVATNINVRNMGNNGTGLYTVALGCDSDPGMLKSGDYYLRVYTNGQYYYIKLNLKITNKLPSVKVTADSFNVFVLNSNGKLNIATNEKINSVSMTEAKPTKGKQTGAFYLNSRWNSEKQLYDYVVYPTSTLISGVQSKKLSSFNMKYNVVVTLQNYNVAVSVPLTVPATYTLPKVKVTPSTVYASDSGYVYADLEVTATMGKDKLNLKYPSYSVLFDNYSPYVNAYSGNNLTLTCPALTKNSVSGTLNVYDNSDWLHPIPVKLTISSQNLAKNCKIGNFAVNAVTKEVVTQQVLLKGKQALKLQYANLVNDGLFYIVSNQNGIQVTPVAAAPAYKNSNYQYTVTLYTNSGEQLKDVKLNIKVNKTAPKVTAPSSLYLDGTQRGREVEAMLSGLNDWSMLNAEATSIAIKKGKTVSSDISAAYTGNGVVTITAQQKCRGKYTVEITPVLNSGEKLKTVKIQVNCVTNASVTAKVKNKLDMRSHLTSETAVALTLKNTSASVESISIVNGFSSIFEIRSVHLGDKNPLIYVGLKDGMDISGGSHALPLKLTLSDGSVLEVTATVTVICSKLSVSMPFVIMAQSAKSLTVTKAFNPVLKDGASITNITNADNKTPFMVSYTSGTLTITAEKRAEVRKGIYTVNCMVYASNDLINAPGTLCKLRVIVR